MTYMRIVMMAMCTAMLFGCVSAEKHQASLKQLDSARKSADQLSKEFESYKQKTAADLVAMEKEKAGLSEELSATNAAKSEVEQANSALRQERDGLQANVRDLQAQTQDLSTKVGTLESQVAGLQDDKQRLMTGTTTAQEEIAKMQRRIGELEVEAARAKDLDARVSERNTQLAQMQKRIGELETEAARAQELDQRLSARDSQLAEMQRRNGELEAEATRARDLEAKLSERDTEIGQLKQAVADREELVAQVAALSGERDELNASLMSREERLQAEAQEKARLEEERAAKEAEIERLTRTHSDLAKSLEAEIAKGNIRIKQVRDRLTINMVDKILFDSGRAEVKPQGLDVLKQVSDVLKTVDDKQIRIEGHTDNVPIRGKLKERFPSNWELSTARATTVVRYLIDQGELDPTYLTAVGHADTQPVASNDEEEGRTQNRRIEIVLYPKDLSDIAEQISSGVNGSQLN